MRLPSELELGVILPVAFRPQKDFRTRCIGLSYKVDQEERDGKRHCPTNICSARKPDSHFRTIWDTNVEAHSMVLRQCVRIRRKICFQRYSRCRKKSNSAQTDNHETTLVICYIALERQKKMKRKSRRASPYGCLYDNWIQNVGSPPHIGQGN